MIYRLQRRFILISTASVLAVIILVLGVIVALNVTSMNRNMDILVDRVSEGGGRFPKNFDEEFKPSKRPPIDEGGFNFITSETPFSTRHFTVFFDSNNNILKTFTESISIDAETANSYANRVISSRGERGWISNYRYKIYDTGSGKIGRAHV